MRVCSIHNFHCRKRPKKNVIKHCVHAFPYGNCWLRLGWLPNTSITCSTTWIEVKPLRTWRQWASPLMRHLLKSLRIRRREYPRQICYVPTILVSLVNHHARLPSNKVPRNPWHSSQAPRKLPHPPACIIIQPFRCPSEHEIGRKLEQSGGISSVELPQYRIIIEPFSIVVSTHPNCLFLAVILSSDYALLRTCEM